MCMQTQRYLCKHVYRHMYTHVHGHWHRQGVKMHARTTRMDTCVDILSTMRIDICMDMRMQARVQGARGQCDRAGLELDG